MSKTLIIAEAGVNHNGRLDLALKLCDAAKACGADVVKFQTFKTANCISPNVPMASYQKKNLGTKESQFEMVRKLELTYPEFRKVKDHCKRIGIEFLSTPPEEESLDFLVSLGSKTVKIGSGEVTNIPYLRKVGAKKVHVIFSTGMATLDEVKKAYAALKSSGAVSVALLHCVTNYPCRFDEVNLNAMLTLERTFKTTVGYSDHTPGWEAAVAAVAMGAKIIEKHFTLDCTMPGPDHKASLEPAGFKAMVEAIRNVEQAMGDGIKKPVASEIEIMKVVRKSIVASRPIRKGDVLSEGNMTVKRAGIGISAADWDRVVGKKARREFAVDELIKV